MREYEFCFGREHFGATKERLFARLKILWKVDFWRKIRIGRGYLDRKESMEIVTTLIRFIIAV